MKIKHKKSAAFPLLFGGGVFQEEEIPALLPFPKPSPPAGQKFISYHICDYKIAFSSPQLSSAWMKKGM